MNDPPSTTVVVSDERRAAGAVDVDVDRWSRLAAAVLADECQRGELTLTFVDPDEIAALNAEHLGLDGPTDVLSFPLDGSAEPAAVDASAEVPVLLGDVVVCPAVAAAQAVEHAGTLDDELALLVVHGVLHVLGHDHAGADETAVMRARELDHLRTHHWRGSPPESFRQSHDDEVLT